MFFSQFNLHLNELMAQDVLVLESAQLLALRIRGRTRTDRWGSELVWSMLTTTPFEVSLVKVHYGTVVVFKY